MAPIVKARTTTGLRPSLLGKREQNKSAGMQPKK